MNFPKVLLATRKEHDYFYQYAGKPYFFDEACQQRQKNACGYLGLSNALSGNFILTKDFFKIDVTKYQCVILPVSGFYDIPHINQWIKFVRKKYPEIIFIGQCETGGMIHRILCRNWEFQKAYYEFSNLVDIMTTHFEPVKEYFELFCEKPLEYLPHPYAVEYFDELGEFKSREQKQKILFKAGHMHGRLFTDGFADAVVLMRVKDRYPEFKIQIQDEFNTRYLINRAVDYSKELLVKRPLSVFLRKLLYGSERIESKVVRRLKLRGYESELGKTEFALTLRGANINDIIKTPHCPWPIMIRIWAQAFAAIDMDYGFITGRNVCDAVASGTPIIGCNSDFQKQLLPELIVDIGDYPKAEKLLLNLIEDQEFYNDLVTKGRKRLEAFSFESTRKRLLNILAKRGFQIKYL